MNCYRVRFKTLKRQTMYSPMSLKTTERFIPSDFRDYWIEAIDDASVYDKINSCVEGFNERSADLKLDFVRIVDNREGKELKDLTKDDLGGAWKYGILCWEEKE